MVAQSQTSQTLFWYDFETFGTNPQLDRPVQFAGVRTDYDFNIVGAPLVIYCKPSLDSLPHPDACLITGITPQLAEEKGLCEAEFIRLIHEQISTPETCTLGYNTLRFDDEVTRNSLYRNFYDPYAREWQNNNSRWDIIDIARAARALRPEGIIWPNNHDERPDFKLEELTKANKINHSSAHDALSDVYATIAFAKLIKTIQPKLYHFLWVHRNKLAAFDSLQLGQFKPVVHISGKYPALKHCLAVVLPICKHPTNANGVIVYDLSIDPEPMLTLSASEIRQRIFTSTEDLPDGVQRIPLKTVHINRCPVLAPISVIKPEDEQRLELNLSLCHANIMRIRAVTDLTEKLSEVFSTQNSEKKESDPDLEIYTGGFFSDQDKLKMATIRASSPRQLAESTFTFHDSRLPEMLFRYRARNFPESLNENETSRWLAFCSDRLTFGGAGVSMTLDKYFMRLEELTTQEKSKQDILIALKEYGLRKMNQLGIKVDSSAPI